MKYLRSLKWIVLAGLVACGSQPIQYTPLANNAGSQAIKVNSQTGKQFILSSEGSSRVAVEQASFPYKGVTFNVKVASDSSTDVSFGTFNISASQGGKNLDVLGKTEMDAAIEARNREMQQTAAMMAVMAGVSSALSSRIPANSPYASSAAAQDAATAQAMATMQTAVQQTSADSQSLSGAVSKTHLSNVTIGPGKVANGLITIPELDRSKPIDLLISVGKEIHNISFIAAKD